MPGISLFTVTRAVIGRKAGFGENPAGGGMELDASVSETHDAQATVTQSEIEDGSQINDHVTLAPLRLAIEGVVSKTPLNLFGLGPTVIATAAAAAAGPGLASTVLATGLASLGGLVSSPAGVNGTTGLPIPRNPKDVYAYLIELRDARIPFDVVTALRLYRNMVLTSVSAPRNVGNVNLLRFTAVMEQVKLVFSQSVNLGANSTLGGAAGGTTNLGTQAPAPAPPAAEASILSTATGLGL